MNEEDLRFDILRAGDYSVKVTHLPTGHVATCTNASLLVAKAAALAELGGKVEGDRRMDELTRERARIADYLSRLSQHISHRIYELRREMVDPADDDILDTESDNARKGRWLLPLPEDWAAAYNSDLFVDYMSGEQTD